MRWFERGRRGTGAALGVVGVLLVVGATTFPDDTSRYRVDHPFCLSCGEFVGTDLVLNVALFVPLGAGVWLLTRRASHALLAGALLSAVVEVLQFELIRGREASVRDLVSNALGAGIGALIARHAAVIVHPSKKAAAPLTALAGGLALMIMAVTAWALQPYLPRGERFQIQWQPVRQGYDIFAGRLVLLEVNGVRVSRAEPLPRDRRPEVYTRGMPPVDATLVGGPPTDGLAPVARMADTLRELWFLGRSRNALVYRFSSNATRLAMRDLAYSLPDAFLTIRPDETVRAHAWVSDGVVELSACRPEGDCRTQRASLSVSRGWSLIAPFNVLSAVKRRALSLLWMAMLLFPVAYWGAWCEPRCSVAAAGTALLGLTIVPLALSLRIAPAGDWLGAAAGLLAGVVAARMLRRPPGDVSPHP